MPLMKISGQGNLPTPVLPIALPAGGVFNLPAGQGIVGAFGSVTSPQLASGNPLTGQYIVQLGQYSSLQVFDYQLQYWRNVNVTPMALLTVSSDGTNFRIINSTGTPVAALITAAGSAGTNGFYGYNAATGPISTPGGVVLPGAAMTIVGGVANPGNAVFTVAASAGGSLWNAIVGGGINTTISSSGTLFENGPFGGTGASVTGSAGSGYVRAPIIVFTPPPNQGNQPYILPCAVCTISGGAINSVTVTQQGAGLLGLPNITVVNQPGDTTGGGAQLGWTSGNSSQVGSGTVMAMWPVFPGTAQTAVTTFSYGGTSNPAPTATAIMNFSVTGITNTTPGVGYTNAYSVWIGGMVAGSAANTNPAFDKNIGIPQFPVVSVVAGTGVTTMTGGFSGVNIQAVPTLGFGTQLAAGTVTTVAVQTPTVGGVNDYLLFESI